MDARLEATVPGGPSRDMMPHQSRLEDHPVLVSSAARPALLDDPLVVEACGLLEDVRMALDCDLGTASQAAGRLAALLDRHSQDQPRAAPAQGGAPRDELARGGLAPWQKRLVLRHIDDRLQDRIRVQDLAKLVSLSPSYFSRAFRDSFGERPHNYITRTRMERAQTLMVTTSLSLSQIALACGLVDQAHLCRCFRQTTGTTPGVWRHRHAIGPRSGGLHAAHSAD
jgi:AraC-like DNA-binding protein